MVGLVDERAAIYTLLSTGWGSTTPIQVPNEIYKADGDNYIRLHIIVNDSDRLEISGETRYTRTLGMIIISVFTAIGTGDLQARTYCNTIENIFRANSASMTDGLIRFREPSSSEIGISDNKSYYQYNVKIPYYRDEVR